MDEVEEQALFIGGSRGFVSYHLLCRTIAYLVKIGVLKDTFTIVSGGARGADTLAREYAEINGLKFIEFKARWDLYGKSAGFKRNKTMVDVSDICLFFWDGVSKGTKHAFDYAYKQNPDNTFIVLY